MQNITNKFIKGYDKNDTYYEYHLDKKNIPTIFIHGVGLNSSAWSLQKKYFKKNILFYDLLNHGRTKKSLKNINYQNLSLQLNNLINYLGFKKINLIGFSIGSLIALQFCSNFNKKINKLVLISSVYKRSKKEKDLVFSRYQLALKGSSISDIAIKRWFSEKYLKENPKIYKKFYKILEQNKKENFLPVYKLFTKSNHEKINFNKFTFPTLIITGEKDINSTPKMSVKLNKKIKNSQIKIVKSMKHMAYYEKSKSVNIEIKKFLK
tara:strand:+ start:357 stop:1151 length:795 start_codon:yes stop_codon:yes gene_type:complete